MRDPLILTAVWVLCVALLDAAAGAAWRAWSREMRQPMPRDGGA